MALLGPLSSPYLALGLGIAGSFAAFADRASFPHPPLGLLTVALQEPALVQQEGAV